MAETKRKCADCGFLAARNRVSRTLDEVEEGFRELGIAPNICDEEGRNPHLGWERCPVCFWYAHDLKEELKAAEAGQMESPAMVQFVLHADRKCDRFESWRRGLTPRQHQEELERIAGKDADRRWRLFELAVSSALTLLSIGAGALIYWLGTRGSPGQ